jgi:Arylsulfatase A and related enzymes
VAGRTVVADLPLFHHKRTLWEGGIRLPCLVRWPARLPAGKVTAQPGITMDLTATFAAAAGARPPEGHRFDGIDLVPIVCGEQPEVERTFCWRVNRSNYRMRAIRHGSWKYIDDAGTMDLLFNLGDDVGERVNLCYRHPEKVAELKERLAAWEAEMDAEPKTFTVR